MKPSTYIPYIRESTSTAHQRGSSSGTANVATITVGRNCSAVLITCETTSARATIDGTDPSAANAPSFVVQKDQNPVFLPIGASSVIKWCSTAAAASVLQVTELQ